MQGLAEQLMTVVVAHERPDLEEARISLIERMANDRQLLQKLEDTLLHELSHASGNILDNQVGSPR
jgi:dynein heavy chain